MSILKRVLWEILSETGTSKKGPFWKRSIGEMIILKRTHLTRTVSEKEEIDKDCSEKEKSGKDDSERKHKNSDNYEKQKSEQLPFWKGNV